MKFNSIKQKLVFYFIAIIAMLVSVSIVLGVLHVKIVKRYENIENNIFLQNHLITATSILITEYNEYRNFQTSDNLEKYLETQKDIRETLTTLSDRITSEDSKGLLDIVDNTIESIFSETDKGIKGIRENDITNTSFYYSEANRKFDFLKENTSNLILREIDHSVVLEKEISKTQTISVIGGGILLFLITLGSILFAIMWSRRLVSPLLEINLVAQEIANGKLDTYIDKDLLDRRDEIGSMSRSFNNMSIRLKQSRSSLETQIQETQAKSTDLRDQVEETKKSKLAIMNLLEDIDEEKKKIEQIVVVRTQELSNEKARLVASINSLSFGFIISDMENHVLLRNKAMADLFGLSDGDTISMEHISEILEGQFDIKNKIKLCLVDKKVCEIREITSGDKFLRGIIAPVLKPDTNELIGYVFMLEDVTEARAIDRAKSEFVSLASHQLRTPLSAINWYTEILASGDAGELNPEQVEYVGEVSVASRRMSDMVGMLLNVSRIEMGTFIIDPKSTNLCSLLRSELDQFKLLIAQKKLDVKLTLEKDDIELNLDPAIMSISIQNLVSNSIKYTPEAGHINVAISIDKTTSDIMLSVGDDGYGIGAAQQSKIFSKLFRADNIKTKDTEGNGLGLYMVKNMLETANCKIWFESKEDGGTTFFITIPKEGMKKKAGTKLLGDMKS